MAEVAPGLAEDRATEVMTVNIGPHHPATHGVLRLVVDLEGEVVKDLRPVIGYVHTGIEKSCEDKSYWKVIPFVERMDYVSYFFQMEAFCGAVERLRVKAMLADPGSEELPEIDSCVELFPTAEFQERESYDFFGIVFRGHPELTRILLPDDYVGWPQRRDFPVGGEPVTFTYSERNYG